MKLLEKERIKFQNNQPIRNGNYVLYWMQASQRTEYNYALEYAILEANKLQKPLIVYFGITDNHPEANERHYHFMLEGLQEVESVLSKRNIKMVIRYESPDIGVINLANDACLLVADRGYLKLQRQWRFYVADSISCPFVAVESDVIVPVEVVSQKEEFSAGTFRPKISRHLHKYLHPIQENQVKVSSLHLEFDSFFIRNIDAVLSKLKIDRSIKRIPEFKGGTTEAKRHLNKFLQQKIANYGQYRNHPNLDYASNLSPYLRFGQISSIYIARLALEFQVEGLDPFLEELIIRRELSINFVFYNPEYDLFHSLPPWAQKTLSEHKNDMREYVYSLEEFELGKTHDPYWNAAQDEMRLMGKMHGYMRMYWGKKILEWSLTPENAFATALFLNNKYELDGSDPNGYAGVAWCFGKHDRAWSERPIFGKVRYMNANGLKRKFDIDAYVEKIRKLEG